MNSTKTAVAHAKNVIARPCMQHKLPHQGIDIVNHLGLRTHAGKDFMRIPAQATTVTKGQVGLFQTPGELSLHGAQLHGIGSRLEDRQDAFARRGLAAQPVNRRSKRRGMVGKVVLNGDGGTGMLDLAADFHTALDIPEGSQGRRSQ